MPTLPSYFTEWSSVFKGCCYRQESVPIAWRRQYRCKNAGWYPENPGDSLGTRGAVSWQHGARSVHSNKATEVSGCPQSSGRHARQQDVGALARWISAARNDRRCQAVRCRDNRRNTGIGCRSVYEDAIFLFSASPMDRLEQQADRCG